ncbi:hypothetical protein [Nevskia sp.]|uniref:hypothetical protein n=1 Tax=Nevskia sp. TaxID=1929292 RepID=UPI003F6F75EB
MSVTIHVEVKNLQEALAKSELVLKYVDGALAAGALLIQREAVRAAPKADGTLHRNIQTGRLQQLLHQVVSRAAHGAYVEQGTGLQGPFRRASGKKNLSRDGQARVALWIARKGIQPRPGVSAERVAWLISRSIARRGTAAQPYLGPANTEQNVSRIADLAQKAVQRGITEAGLG